MPDPAAPALKRRTAVELVRTGRWPISTGTWNPTPADLAAAVEASQCPAIRNPIIKLGHEDPRFTGEPALGWFENLRLADGGHTLLADQVTLPWLHDVQAAAYPDRSVEGNYNHRCANGHMHPFALTAVALLGVTPPGVKTLTSIQDLPDWLGVAAAAAPPEGARRVQATIRAADDEPRSGAMVALIPADDDAARLAVDGGEPAEQLHVTLAYLGDAVDLDAADRQDLIDAVSSSVNGMPVVAADAFALSVFNPTGSDPCVALGLSGTDLDGAHEVVEDALSWTDVALPSQHAPWVPHITLMYTGDLGVLSAVVDRVGQVRFDRIRIALAGQHLDIPLVQQTADSADSDMTGVAAAVGNDLKDYWLHGAGLAKWAASAHPWTALYRHLRKHVGAPRAKRIASQWFHDHFGYWPGDRRHRGKVAAVADSLSSETGADVNPDPDVLTDSPDTNLPAAEPDQPTKEDPVSELTAGVRQRLGLADDADDATILTALDALKTLADTPTPDEQAVAAAALAAERAETDRVAAAVARTEMSTEISRLSGELAAIKAAAAVTAKKALFDRVSSEGRITPDDRESWEARYDKAPDVIAEVLASIAPGTAVPVVAAGTTGPPEPDTDTHDDTWWAQNEQALFGPSASSSKEV
jgi:2'-5' RNA ligase